MNGERVAQQVRRYRLANTGKPTCLLAGLLDCTSVDGLANDIPLEEPTTWPRRSPIRPQGLQQLRRKHHVAVFLPLALFNTDDHALTIDVGRSEANRLGDA